MKQSFCCIYYYIETSFFSEKKTKVIDIVLKSIFDYSVLKGLLYADCNSMKF